MLFEEETYVSNTKTNRKPVKPLEQLPPLLSLIPPYLTMDECNHLLKLLESDLAAQQRRTVSRIWRYWPLWEKLVKHCLAIEQLNRKEPWAWPLNN